MGKTKLIYLLPLIIITGIFSLNFAFSEYEEDEDNGRYEYERGDDDRYEKTSIKEIQNNTILDESQQLQIDTSVNNFYNKLVLNNYSSSDINTTFSNVLDKVNTKINSENLSEKNLLILTYLKSSLENKISTINLDLNDLLNIDITTVENTSVIPEKQISTFTSSGGRVFSIYQKGDRFYFIRPDGTKSDTDFPTSDEVIKYLSLNTKPKVVTTVTTAASKTVKPVTTTTAIVKPVQIQLLRLTTPTVKPVTPTVKPVTPAKPAVTTTPRMVKTKVDTTTKAS